MKFAPTGIRASLCYLRAGTLAAMLCVAAAADAEEINFDLRIERGTVPQKMRVIRVKQGDTVRLRWRTDKPLVLHLHGYDIEKKIGPGAVAEMVFEARIAGRFPVEVHKHGQGVAAHEETPLVQVEVYPR
jgi:hypothetical protein